MTSAPRRIHHLVDPAGPGGGRATLRQVRRFIEGATEADHRVVVLGHDAHVRSAQFAGLMVDDAVALPAGRRGAAARSLGRTAGAGLRDDVWIAWGVRAAAVAARAGARRAAAWSALPTCGPGGDHPGEVVIRASPWSEPVGWDGFAPLRRAAHGVLPGLGGPSAGRDEEARAARRAALRAAWGARDDELVAALVVDPPARGDARTACYAAAIACVAGRPVRLLVHPRAHAADRWARWSRTTGLAGAVSVEARVVEPWSIADGLDMTCCVGEAREARGAFVRLRRRSALDPLAVLETMAAGVPVIAEDTPLVSALLGVDALTAPGPRPGAGDRRPRDGGAALLVDPADHVALSRALVALSDSPGERARLAEAGRTLIAQRYGVSAFVNGLRRVVGAL